MYILKGPLKKAYRTLRRMDGRNTEKEIRDLDYVILNTLTEAFLNVD